MVKRERETFLHISQIRGTIKKFAVVLAFVCAFVFMLLSKSENVLIEKTSGTAGEIVSSAVDVLVMPAAVLVKGYEYLRSLRKIDLENRALREENRRLTIANAESRALLVENVLLRQLLNYTPPPEATYVTARVIAEEGNAFSHSLIAYTGGSKNVKKGQVVLSDNGVIGRIEQVGKMYSKIILITDINSKIPVIVERTRVRGILSGDNTSIPKLVFIPLDAELSIGDRVVSSGVAGVFPPCLPIGKVSSVEKNNIKIKTFGNLDRLEYVKIVDYGLADMLQQEEIIQPEQTGE